MHRRLRWVATCSVALALVSGVLTIVAPVTVQAAAMPPFEPDQSARGCLNFYDAQGNVQAGGSIADSPMVAFAQAAGPTRSGGGGPDNTGTLFGYLAFPGEAPNLWPGEQMSAGNSFPAPSEPASLAANRKNPTYAAATDEESVGTLQTHYPHPKGDPAGYQGVYQIRFITSGQASGTDPLYWRADIQITGKTWTQIWCTPPAQNAGGSSTGAAGAGGSQAGGSTGTATSTVGSSGKGGSGAVTGTNAAGSAAGQATSTTGSSAGQAAGKSTKGKAGGRSLALALLIAAVVVIVVALFWGRARRRSANNPDKTVRPR